MTVDREADALILRDGAGSLLARWPLTEVRRVDRPDGTRPGRLSLGRDDAARLLLEQAAYETVAAWCPTLTKRDISWNSHGRPFLLWTGAAVLSVTLLFAFIIPWMARVIALSLPSPWEAELGKASEDLLVRVVARIEHKSPEQMICAEGPGLEILQRLLRQMVAQPVLGLTQPPTLAVLDTDLVNALALPGGRMVLLRGLIDEAKHPNELLGVLAHEMGHLAKRHPTEMAVQTVGTSVLLSLLIGDATGGTGLTLMGESLINGAYSRDKERAADAVAVETLAAAGWDPRPFALFFDRLAKQQGGLEEHLSWISSHPLSEDRAAAIRAAQGPSGIAMTDLEWARVRTICKGQNSAN